MNHNDKQNLSKARNQKIRRKFFEYIPENWAYKPLHERKYIAVSGNIGAGKTSLVEFLCEKYQIEPYFEPNELNPYLTDFYDNMAHWSFHSQIYFLTAKFALHQKIEQNSSSLIQDRTIWEDAEIFARNLSMSGLMSKRDFETYTLLYNTICETLTPPDLMIYLKCSVPTLLKRIKQRGRPSEINIPRIYLRNLNILYKKWISNYTLSPVIVIPSSNFDYITNLVDCHELLSLFDRYLPRRETT